MMSGEIPQNKRIKTLEGFRSGKIEVLVATDVAGRGIHIDGVSHVVNYQLPEDADDYVHRIGRTGRAGATGESICFACEDDSFLIPDIESMTGVKLNCIHPEAELLVDPSSVTVEESVESAPIEMDAIETETVDAPVAEEPVANESVELTDVSSEETAGEIDVLPLEASAELSEEQLDLDMTEESSDKESRS